MIDAILQLMPLDADYCEHPVEYMVPDKTRDRRSNVRSVDDAIAAVEKNGYSVKQVGEIERTKFYEKAGKAYVTVCTSERQPYGCFIMQKGVL